MGRRPMTREEFAQWCNKLAARPDRKPMMHLQATPENIPLENEFPEHVRELYRRRKQGWEVSKAYPEFEVPKRDYSDAAIRRIISSRLFRSLAITIDEMKRYVPSPLPGEESDEEEGEQELEAEEDEQEYDEAMEAEHAPRPDPATATSEELVQWLKGERERVNPRVELQLTAEDLPPESEFVEEHVDGYRELKKQWSEANTYPSIRVAKRVLTLADEGGRHKAIVGALFVKFFMEAESVAAYAEFLASAEEGEKEKPAENKSLPVDQSAAENKSLPVDQSAAAIGVFAGKKAKSRAGARKRGGRKLKHEAKTKRIRLVP